MTSISQIIIKKKIMGRYMGAWSSPMSFSDFYITYEDKESIIQNGDVCRCIDDSGDILSTDKAYSIYLEMEKELIRQHGTSGSMNLTFG